MTKENHNTKVSFTSSLKLLSEIFTCYLKSFFRSDLVIVLFVLGIGVATSLWLFSDNVENTNELEGIIITISNLSSLIIFTIPFSITILSLNFHHIFSLLDNESKDTVLKHKIFFTTFFSFIRVLLLSFITLFFIWTFTAIMWPKVFANANLLSIFVYSIAFITFWFLFSTVCLDIFPKKYLTTFTQITSVILIISGGYIIPAISFPPALNTITQILPTRATGDVLLYNFFGTRIPGGAIVTFLEYFVVFACLFVIVLKRCKNNRRVLFF